MSDMDTPEVLQKALDKATAGGWKSTRRERCDLWDNEQQCWYEQEDRQHVYEIIFSHDFAKSIWGEESYKLTVYDVNTPSEYVNTQMVQQPMWSYYLQQMVISDDPIEYLGEHLDG